MTLNLNICRIPVCFSVYPQGLLLLAALCTPTLRADEGMWLLGRTDARAMAAARQLGLQLLCEGR